MAPSKARAKSSVLHPNLKGDIAAEQLLKWLALAILTSIIVIGLMKGMLALAVYLIRTLPLSMVS